MTICIGMVCSDGVVIAADTNESDTYFKRSTSKIYTGIGGVHLSLPPDGSTPLPPSSVCAIAGAGEGGYCDALSEKLLNVFLDPKPTKNLQDIQSDFEKCLIKFYSDHITTFAEYPFQDRPDLAMLIGLYANWQTTLLVTDKSTVRRAVPYQAVGVGQTFAMNLMDNLWRNATIEETEILANYIIFATKESIEGCGKFTSVISLRNPTMVNDPDGLSSKLVPPPLPLTRVRNQDLYLMQEKRFRIEWAFKQRELIWEMIREEIETNNKAML